MIQMVAPELMNVVQDLSDDQVIALWSLDPNFARALKMNYDIVMEWLSGGEEAVIEAYNTEAFRRPRRGPGSRRCSYRRYARFYR